MKLICLGDVQEGKDKRYKRGDEYKGSHAAKLLENGSVCEEGSEAHKLFLLGRSGGLSLDRANRYAKAAHKASQSKPEAPKKAPGKAPKAAQLD